MTAPPGAVETWMKELADGSFAVGFFNRTDETVKVNFPWQTLGLDAPLEVRDLWVRSSLGQQTNFTAELPAHGCVLVQVRVGGKR